jgi:hypothetical protein
MSIIQREKDLFIGQSAAFRPRDSCGVPARPSKSVEESTCQMIESEELANPVPQGSWHSKLPESLYYDCFQISKYCGRFFSLFFPPNMPWTQLRQGLQWNDACDTSTTCKVYYSRALYLTLYLRPDAIVKLFRCQSLAPRKAASLLSITWACSCSSRAAYRAPSKAAEERILHLDTFSNIMTLPKAMRHSKGGRQDSYSSVFAQL